jgi:transglutaminase-like putative cysteine protease
MSTAVVALPDIPDERPGVARLTWVMVALGLVLAPLALHLPPVITGFALMLGVWRVLAERRGWAMPRTAVRASGALLGLVAVWATFRTISGAEAGTALLVVMTALKLTETTTVRDCILLVILGYFLMLGQVLWSQEIWIALWLLPTAWLLTAVFLAVSHPSIAFHPLAALRASGRYLLLALPVMAAMFVLFPRVPGPLWGAPAGRGDAISGLGDTMDPGSISNLIRSDEVAFRVEVLEGRLPRQKYWRGPTLHLFDGRAWSQSWIRYPEPGAFVPGGEVVAYTVTLEAHYRPWLFALEMPLDLPRGAEFRHDYTMIDPRLVRERRAYSIRSAVGSLVGRDEPARRLRWGLQLPEVGSPRARALVAGWRAEGLDDAAVVGRALRLFREEPFVYTLSPPRIERDFVDAFLFDTRRGFCEHYASSFTFLMRAAGIPARVVTGYLGGERNPLSGDWVVRQSDAHAWSEVWIAGRGWVRVDPTAAVAPERIEGRLEDVLPEGEAVPGGYLRTFDLLLTLRDGWDAVDAAWNRFFIGYGPELQRDLMARLGLERADWRTLSTLLLVVVTALLLALSGWLYWTHRPRPVDAARREWDRFGALLTRAGVAPGPAEGPLDLAERAAAALPARRREIDRVAAAYVAARYARPSADALPELREAVRAFRRAA